MLPAAQLARSRATHEPFGERKWEKAREGSLAWLYNEEFVEPRQYPGTPH